MTLDEWAVVDFVLLVAELRNVQRGAAMKPPAFDVKTVADVESRVDAELRKFLGAHNLPETKTHQVPK